MNARSPTNLRMCSISIASASTSLQTTTTKKTQKKFKPANQTSYKLRERLASLTHCSIHLFLVCTVRIIRSWWWFYCCFVGCCCCCWLLPFIWYCCCYSDSIWFSFIVAHTEHPFDVLLATIKNALSIFSRRVSLPFANARALLSVCSAFDALHFFSGVFSLSRCAVYAEIDYSVWSRCLNVQLPVYLCVCVCMRICIWWVFAALRCIYHQRLCLRIQYVHMKVLLELNLIYTNIVYRSAVRAVITFVWVL